MTAKMIGVFAILVSVGLCDDTQPDLDVPFEPTHPEVVAEMLRLADVTSKDIVYDLGCGDGRIVVTAAKKFGARGYGIDIDPQRLRDAEENAKQAGVAHLVTFQKGDLKEADIAKATVVTLYLLDSVNLEIRPKLFRDLQPGTRIVSHAFDMDDWKCDKKVKHDKARNDIIYCWVIPGSAGGTWRWKEKTADGEAPVRLELRQDFQALRGSFTGPVFKSPSPVRGSMTGRQLNVAATMHGNKGPVEVRLEGTVSGDTVEGTQTWNMDEKVVKRPWRATRQPVALAGEWRLSTRSRSKELSGVLRISGTDGRPKVAYLRDGEESPVEASALYLWGASMRCEIPWENGESAVFTGTFHEKNGRGTADGGGLSGRLTWKAQRVSAQ